MRTEEERALKTGKLLGDGVDPLVPEVKNVLPEGYELSIWNFIVPMAALFISLFATIFWSGDLANNGLVGCFRSANITLAICVAFLGGGIGAGVMGIATGLFKPLKAFDTFIDGMIELINVPFILIAAWSLGPIVKSMGTGGYCAAVPHSRLGSCPGVPVRRLYLLRHRFLLGRVVHHDAHCFPHGCCLQSAYGLCGGLCYRRRYVR